jgi:hypothetical protein
VLLVARFSHPVAAIVVWVIIANKTMSKCQKRVQKVVEVGNSVLPEPWEKRRAGQESKKKCSVRGKKGKGQCARGRKDTGGIF